MILDANVNIVDLKINVVQNLYQQLFDKTRLSFALACNFF